MPNGNVRLGPTTRKETWDLDRWAAFGTRCQAVRDGVSGLIRALPDTRGLTVAHVNSLIRAHDKAVAAMIHAETVLVRQHEYSAWLTVIHGAKGTTCWGPCRGRVKPSAPPLSRERWAALGREVKAVRAAAMALILEFQGTAGATKPYVNRFARIVDAIDSAKCRLDALLYLQHPDWPDFGRVFYGADAELPAVGSPEHATAGRAGR